MENKKYSYVSLLTDDSYVYGIILLHTSLQKVQSKYPLHVLITEDVCNASREILNQLDITYELVDKIKIPDIINNHNRASSMALAVTWENCWTKLKIYNLTQFDKIVFLDADILVLKNLDHLFDKPHMTSALDGEYFNLWPGWDHFNSGVLVIEPSYEEYKSILEYGYSLKTEDLPDYTFADQELLNFYYKDWPNHYELHLNKYYDIFPPYVETQQLEDLKDNTYFVHYVGRKPWAAYLKSPLETYDEYYYNLGREYIQEYIQTINWPSVFNKLILTVYAICKNEKPNVEKWLKSFGEADYICILDTGSTDGTWELLNKLKKKYSNLIIKQQTIIPWRFDTARNESLKLVPKETDIFFMVDLDEIIKEPGWSNKVKMAWTPTFSRGMYNYHRDVDENDIIQRTIQEFRLHSKFWDHYKNIVHEAIYNKAEEKIFYIQTCTPVDIAVWHYPKKDKKTNYLELCEKDIEENPEDYVMRLQLAIECEIEKETEKAGQQYQYIISHQNPLQTFELARCFTGLALIAIDQQHYDEALFYLSEGRIACPFFTDNYIIAAQILYNSERYLESIELIQKGIKYCSESFWCNIYDINTFLPYYILGLSYNNIKELLKSIANLSIAYQLNPTEELQTILSQTIQQYLITNEKEIIQ